MTDDLNTKDMSDRELLLLIRTDQLVMLERLTSLNERVSSLEARTNPLPQNYDARFTALEADLKEMKRDVRELKYEMKQLRDHDWKREGELGKLQEWVEELAGLRAA